MQDLRDQQLKYEEDTDHAAAAERLEALRNAAKDGDAELPRAQRYIARAYMGVKQSLDDALAVKTRGVGGKFKGWLRKIPTDVTAVLALRECISMCLSGQRNNKPVTIALLGLHLGKLIELEIRIRDAETVNPLYMKRIHEQVQEHGTTSQAHLRKLYNTAYHRIMHDDELGAESVLAQSDMLNLGKFAVQACLDAGVIESHRTQGRDGTTVYYELTAEVAEFLTDYTDNDVKNITNKATGAMMCAPDPWTNLRDGGYLSPRRKIAQPLMSLASIRKSERARLRQEFTAEKMPQVFNAVNYMQSIPFSVHRPTLDAIVRLWQAGGGVMGVPTKGGPAKPVFPFSEEWEAVGAPPEEVEVFTDWKRATARYYDSLKSWRSKVREISGFIKTVRDLNESLWFPMFMDKRGRLYYRGSPNPQGSDLAKASLHLAERKPLGKDGVYWLKVHIANCAGYDKTTFDDRAAWTESRWDAIRRALAAPEDFPDVWGKDAPWCMYSAAYELEQAFLSGAPEQYESGVIVHMDATCSGLQHFSAILRDPVGGSFVNLVGDPDATQKQDIYAKVALNAMRVIEQDSLDPDPDKAAIALWWLRTGIPRGMAKKPVMTYVYGATLRGTIDFVEDYIRAEMGVEFPEGHRPFDVASYAAKKLFQGIAATVPAAEAAMQWLRSVARQMPKGQRMEWRTPTGFRVQHDYMDWDEQRVDLRSCGVTKVVIREYNDDTKPLPMQNAIAPNFVHALDASHIVTTALEMQQRNLAIVGIHDSYGTHACDVAQMHASIRDSFINLYQSRNVLAEFLWEVNGVGEVPMRGTLDLENVRNSMFFFC